MITALVLGDQPMARQRKVKIIIAATAMFHDDTHLHTELPLPLNRCDANGQA